MPIYVRAGAILPMGPKIQHTAENTFGKLVIRVYPGEDGQFVLYEDDGYSYGYQQGEYMKTEFKWNDRDATLIIRPDSGMNLCPGNQREITVRLMSTGKSKSLKYRREAASVIFED